MKNTMPLISRSPTGHRLYNKHMVRTQVYLTDKQKTTIELLAKRRRTAEAELIRDLIDAGLQQAQAEDAAPASALLELVQLGKQLDMRGPADLSARHDNELYGDQGAA